MQNQALLEAIPNISLFLDKEKIAAFEKQIALINNVSILHIDPNKDANRTVITFAGNFEGIHEAIMILYEFCMQYVDMRKHHGTHPRIGMVDVCPIVPLQNCSLEDAIRFTNELAIAINKKYGIALYFYEYNQNLQYRKYLPQIRKGGYEMLLEKTLNPIWKPDLGKDANCEEGKESLEKYGATVIGVRDILIAYNISLNTKSLNWPQQWVQKIRSSGDFKGKKGLFEKLRAIAWYMDDFGHVQISMNFLDYHTTNPVDVYAYLLKEVQKQNIEIIGSELVGLIPKSVLIFAGKKINPQINEEMLLINQGVKYLGLNAIKDFDANKHILEFVIDEKLNIQLDLE